VDSCFPSESLHPLFIVEPLSRPLLIHNNNRDRFMTPEFPARSSPDFLLSLTASETNSDIQFSDQRDVRSPCF